MISMKHAKPAPINYVAPTLKKCQWVVVRFSKSCVFLVKFDTSAASKVKCP